MVADDGKPYPMLYMGSGASDAGVPLSIVAFNVSGLSESTPVANTYGALFFAWSSSRGLALGDNRVQIFFCYNLLFSFGCFVRSISDDRITSGIGQLLPNTPPLLVSLAAGIKLVNLGRVNVASCPDFVHDLSRSVLCSSFDDATNFLYVTTFSKNRAKLYTIDTAANSVVSCSSLYSNDYEKTGTAFYGAVAVPAARRK